jgi:hypothetical protein
LGEYGQFVRSTPASCIITMFVGQQRPGWYPTMGTDLAVLDLAGVQEADEVRPRHVQQVGRLLGGQFGVGWDDRDPVSARHVRQDASEKFDGGSRDDKLIPRVI